MRLKKYLSATFAVVIVLFFCAAVQAGKLVIEEWAGRYNGPGNGEDWARAIAIDDSNNICVTGYSDGNGTGKDYATIKYGPDSNVPLWVARYDGPASGDDEARAVATDKSGNVYVTGKSYSVETHYDCTTIKYSSDSNEPLWVARYDGPGYSEDYAVDIAMDDYNNIYITGYSGPVGSDWDYVTIKYGPDSNEPLWVARYDGGVFDDAARAIAVDSNLGSVYVTGYSEDWGADEDCVTIKYNTDSNQPVWVARYDGPVTDSEDQPRAIAIDDFGNVYIAGYADDTDAAAPNYVTIKYAPDSNIPLWVATYDGPGNWWDEAFDIAVDNLGDVYVTGRSTSSDGDFDYATVKYNSDGNELWVAWYDGQLVSSHDEAWAIAVDDSRNVYVTGCGRQSATDYDYTTIKYGPDSNEPVWVATYNGTGGYPREDSAHAIALDGSGNIYVTGKSDGSGTGKDYATVKYSQPVCTSPVDGDVNNDCEVDFKDFAIIALNWLECNLDPPSACWD